MIASYKTNAVTLQRSLPLECVGSKLSPWPVYLFIFLSMASSSVEFREPRVIELWEAAKRANLSEDELDSLKVALTSLVTVLETLLLSPLIFERLPFVFSVFSTV